MKRGEIVSDPHYTRDQFEQVRADELEPGCYLMRDEQDGSLRADLLTDVTHVENLIALECACTTGRVMVSLCDGVMEIREVDFTRTPPVAFLVLWVDHKRKIDVLKPEFAPMTHERYTELYINDTETL